MGVDCDVRHLQLCSVSDDRSIRVWQITTPVDDDVDTTAQEKDRLSVEWWRMASFEPVHVLFGHGARIWDVRILEDGYVSIGEVSVIIKGAMEWGRGHVIVNEVLWRRRSCWFESVSFSPVLYFCCRMQCVVFGTHRGR